MAQRFEVLRGLFGLLPTPYGEDLEIHTCDLRAAADFCCRSGQHGIVWPVMVGEFYFLGEEERVSNLDAVLEEVAAWQARPLEAVYPIVFFDALRVKIRDEGFVRNKAVHIALGVRADGTKEILGLWLEQNEGAKFWLRVMNEMKHRGVEDVLLAIVDGLKGFPEAIVAVFPGIQWEMAIGNSMGNGDRRFDVKLR